MIQQKITSETKSDNFILIQEEGSTCTYNIKIDLLQSDNSNTIHKTVEDIERELVEKFNQTQTKTNSKHDKKDLSKKSAKLVIVKFCLDLASKQYYEISYSHLLINLRGKNLV